MPSNIILSGTSVVDTLDEIEKEVKEVERHLHNVEIWFGPAAVPVGEDHAADRLGAAGDDPAGVLTSFRATSGVNKAWGVALQVWGATDHLLMPVTTQAFQDAHRLRMTDAEENKHEWLLRTIVGESAAVGVAAGTYGTLPLFVDNVDKEKLPVDVITRRVSAGAKIWIQLLHVTDNTAKYVDLQWGVHGYPPD